VSGRLPVIPNGLGVIRAPSGHWVVVHLGSGTKVVQYCPTRPVALAAAEKLGPVTDWTRTREELVAEPEVDRAIRLADRDIAEATILERRARRRTVRR